MSTVEQTQPLISHLLELRNRLLKAIAAVLVVFVGLIYFSNHIYEFVSAPLVERLPEGATMIATDVASPFFTPLKLTLIASVFIAVPFILYQVWAFVAPGLYKHERRLIMPLRFLAHCCSTAVWRLLTSWYSHWCLASLPPSLLVGWSSQPTSRVTSTLYWRCLWRLVSRLKYLWR